MDVSYSIIVPVYNRPKEIEEFLDSCLMVIDINTCEIVIVEDGSEQTCKDLINKYFESLNISYFYKPNTGPGDSRNYGMIKAKGSYFIILDSDVLLPEAYIQNINKNLNENDVDCFGGVDRAHYSFTPIQKAINYTMTSFFTTGGIRGSESQQKNFQPRSFNMGLSKQAFKASNGFSRIHPGEDPDLSIRLNKLGYKTALFAECYVYHKRRISWISFSKQVYKFGLVRPILNYWHPKTHKLLYYFPTFFSFGLLFSLFSIWLDFYFFIQFYIFYFTLILVDSLRQEKSLLISVFSIYAVLVQFFGYGWGYLKSSIEIFILKREPEDAFPFLFFKKD